MNVDIRLATYEQFEALLCPDHERRDLILRAAKLSPQIIVGLYNKTPLCYIGLVPKTLISNSAYVWMEMTVEGWKHPFIIGRHAKETITRILSEYDFIWGDCFSLKSRVWLESLGAEFSSDTEFTIGRK